MLAVDVLESLELLGSSQWGLVTTTQASEAGVSKMHLSRLADRGTRAPRTPWRLCPPFRRHWPSARPPCSLASDRQPTSRYPANGCGVW